MPFAFRHLKVTLTAMVVAVAAFGASADPAPFLPQPAKPNLDNYISESHARSAADTGSAPTRALPGSTAHLQPERPLTQADSEAVEQVLALLAGGASSLESDGVTRGLTLGSSLPAVPSMADLDHATAQAVVAAFARPKGMTAEQQAQNAATTAADPAVEERVALIRTLYRVDGTDALVRHFIGTVHMRLIITEVNNHIEIARLSEGNKYRLSAVAAAAETELEEKVLNMNARQQAANMSKAEIMQLITAYDSDAQRKLTSQRLTDSGKLDRALDLDIRIAQYQIVKQYEAE